MGSKMDSEYRLFHFTLVHNSINSIKTMKKYYKQFVYFIVFAWTLPVSGQSVQDLQRLKAEYEKIQKAQSKQAELEQLGLEGVKPETGLPDRAEVIISQIEDELLEEKEIGLKHFGYDFFTQRDTIPFWENLPTPSNYLLGAGDELVVSLWGETQLRQTYTINREGKIYDSKVGLLNITGKTIAEARQYLNDQFGRVYATLKGNSPTTYMDVSLGELRLINVNFVGEVNYPGVYPIHPFSTVITGLIQAGGVDTTGSLRNIQIKRDGKPHSAIDLYDYFLKGDLPKNIQLRDQDIVFIPVRKSIVTVDSAVVNPGIYESQNGETIYDMIEFAGGLSSKAGTSIGLSRIIPLSERGNGKIAFEPFYIDFVNTKLISARDGDEIYVRYLFPSLQRVEIIGRVKSPGEYHFQKGMTFKDLVTLSGGFEDSTFWESVYHDRAEIIRRDPDTRYEEIIELNLDEIVNGNGIYDIALENLDRVVVHPNLNFLKSENVKILGEVKIPGSYPLLKDEESLRALIERAGGFTSKAYTDGIEMFRDTIRVAWESTDIALSQGDSVVVKKRPGVVYVTGEVYNPGFIEFQNGKSLKYYIDAAGGVTTTGNLKDVMVLYANGTVKPKKFLSSPKVKDGATIVVNMKKLEKPFDAIAFAVSWSQVITSMISTYLLILQVTQ